MITLGIVRLFFPHADIDKIATGKDITASSITLQEIYVMRIMQTVYSLGAFILPSLLFFYLWGVDAKAFTGLDRKPQTNYLVLAICIMIASTGIIGLVNYWNENMTLPENMKDAYNTMRNLEDQAETTEKAFLSTVSPLGILMNFLIIGVLAAVGEELFFRGILQNIFRGWTKSLHAGVWIGAVIFSTMHFEFFGFFPRLLLGALLGYLYAWSGTLWTSMIAHFINNAAAIIVSYYLSNGILHDDVTETANWQFALFSLVLTGTLLWIFRSITRRETADGG